MKYMLFIQDGAMSDMYTLCEVMNRKTAMFP